MSDFDPGRAADALQDARARREKLTGLPEGVAPRTQAEGAAVQRALAERTGAGQPAGFKIGATAQRMQEYLGLSGPAAGFMAVSGLHASGASVPYNAFVHPGVECELAVRLARDLPPAPCTLEQATEAVGDLMAAIEIVENRYGDLARLGTATLIADQVFHAGAVLGEGGTEDWRGLDIAALPGRITVDGHVRDEGVASDLLGHPFQCLAWLAGSEVAAAFGGLRAGQTVLLGSVTPPLWLSGPARVEVEFPPPPICSVNVLSNPELNKNTHDGLDRGIRTFAAGPHRQNGQSRNSSMLSDWNLLSDDLQLTLSREALQHAALSIADQAEVLASEMEFGSLTDRGGPEALRLLAAVVRITGQDTLTPVGHA